MSITFPPLHHLHVASHFSIEWYRNNFVIPLCFLENQISSLAYAGFRDLKSQWFLASNMTSEIDLCTVETMTNEDNVSWKSHYGKRENAPENYWSLISIYWYNENNSYGYPAPSKMKLISFQWIENLRGRIRTPSQLREVLTPWLIFHCIHLWCWWLFPLFYHIIRDMLEWRIDRIHRISNKMHKTWFLYINSNNPPQGMY